jgi:cleavage and polyadenylation specificity factor subunit 1
MQDFLRREIPYSPSYVVQLSDLDTKINNVKDLTFLPGFHSPTIAVLYENLQSWAK